MRTFEFKLNVFCKITQQYGRFFTSWKDGNKRKSQSFIEKTKPLYQRLIQNPVKDLRWSVLRK